MSTTTTPRVPLSVAISQHVEGHIPAIIALEMAANLTYWADRNYDYVLSQTRNLRLGKHEIAKLFQACDYSGRRFLSLLLAYEFGLAGQADVHRLVRYWGTERTDVVLQGLEAAVGQRLAQSEAAQEAEEHGLLCSL